MPSVPATPDVSRVEWLPSGSGTGIVRVSGRGRLAGAALPDLLLKAAGGEVRFESLPDAGSDPEAWRAAYVVEEARLAAPGVELELHFPDGASLSLPPPPVAPVASPAPAPPPEPAGGQVIERAVLAERRARRAEAAEQAQARIAERALRAVEVLEGRADEIDRRLAESEAERDLLRERLAEREAERADGPTADTLRRLLAAAGLALSSLRGELTELRATLTASETAHAATRVRLAAAERELAAAEREPVVAAAPEPVVEPEPIEPKPAITPAPEPLVASPESLASIRRSLAELAEPVPPAAAAAASPATARVTADLDAAAAALRDRAASPPVSEPGPQEETSHLPPAAPARPLPEALLALAREDPAIAARLLVALLPVQHVALSGPIDYDITIAEAGTFAVSATPFTASVTERERPRAFWHRSFHVRADAVALIELLAGRRPLRRLRGPVRVQGRLGRARELLTRIWTGASAQALLDAGARLPADAVIPLLPHLVEPSWTAGHRFCVQIVVDHPWYIRALDGDGVAVGRTAPSGVAIDTTLLLSTAAFAASIAGRRLGANDRFDLSGDPRPVAILFGWVQRARGG